MLIFKEIQAIRNHLIELRRESLTIGLVPTMGALHDGHLALIKQADEECDHVVCSIYVNPKQFNNPEDLGKYPRTLTSDLKVLEESGCHIVFCPGNDEMYKSLPMIDLKFGRLETIMEGKYRPGHFSGVGLVVSKLFNIIQPNSAYFGLKDYQQFMIIRKLVEDLSMDIKLVGVKTIRDEDGLAMSSRNKNLNEHERQQAPIFYNTLKKAVDLIQNGNSVKETKEFVDTIFETEKVELEYFKIANSEDLSEPNNDPSQSLVLCIAGYVGKTRLIDNILTQ